MAAQRLFIVAALAPSYVKSSRLPTTTTAAATATLLRNSWQKQMFSRGSRANTMFDRSQFSHPEIVLLRVTASKHLFVPR